MSSNYLTNCYSMMTNSAKNSKSCSKNLKTNLNLKSSPNCSNSSYLMSSNYVSSILMMSCSMMTSSRKKNSMMSWRMTQMKTNCYSNSTNSSLMTPNLKRTSSMS